jgi:hypothetical protein
MNPDIYMDNNRLRIIAVVCNDDAGLPLTRFRATTVHSRFDMPSSSEYGVLDEGMFYDMLKKLLKIFSTHIYLTIKFFNYFFIHNYNFIFYENKSL